MDEGGMSTRSISSFRLHPSSFILSMTQLNEFFNDGFGWVCRHCEREFASASTDEHSRLLREGEAESKQPRLSNSALAKWGDPEQRTLVCPRCGITERVEKS